MKFRWITTAVAGIAAASLMMEVPTTAVSQPSIIAVNQKATRITAAQIRQILDQMQKAVTNQDMAGILKYMAPDIQIEATVRSGARAQTIKLTRAQYRQSLQQGFEMTQNRSSRLSNLKVNVAPDGKSAIATYTLIEESTLKAQPVTISSVSSESVKFELIQGQILETLVKSSSRLSVKQP